MADSRVWLITGTSSGLGRALLEAVLLKGERAVATVRRAAALGQLEAKYPKEQLLVLPLDVTNAAQIDKVFKAVEDNFHRLDVVVNNAGYGLIGDTEGMPDDKARDAIETLFWGPVNITKQAVRFFREVNPRGQGGRVLNISSMGGYEASPTLAFYAAGKFALEGFTESITREMQPAWNIKALIIEPGSFDTNWTRSGMVHGPPHSAYDKDSPGARFRGKLFSRSEGIGDIAKAAQAMIRIAGESNPPMRLQLGSDSWGVVNLKAASVLRDQEKWADVSHGTNRDGVDGQIYVERLKKVRGKL